MKWISWLIAIAAAVIGLSLGAALFSRPSNANPDELLKEIEDLNSTDRAQKQEIERLKQSVEKLSQALESRGFGPGSTESTSSLASTPNSEIRRESATQSASSSRSAVSQLESAMQTSPEPTPEFRNWVARVIDDRKVEEENAVKKEQEERRAQRVARRVEKAAEELQLNEIQKNELGRILTEEEIARTQLMEKFRQEEMFLERDSLTQAWRDVRNTRNQALQTILTSEQIEKFQAGDRRRFGSNPLGGLEAMPRQR